MKYFYIIIILFLGLYSCNDTKKEVNLSNETVQVKDVSEETINASLDTIYNMIQGSWFNTLDPNSVIIFKENTFTNMYQDIISKDNVPYKISTNCIDDVAVTASQSFNYINTIGDFNECYKILTLEQNKLAMEFMRGDVILTFERLENN